MLDAKRKQKNLGSFQQTQVDLKAVDHHLRKAECITEPLFPSVIKNI